MNLNSVTLEISAGSVKQFVNADLPEIAFSGKSNVGKSSLINCLLNRKSLARVSATPGKTVTINFYNIDNCCRFVDLPGYGYAKVSRAGQNEWSPVVDKYFADKNRCTLVVQLIDIRHALSDNDALMLDYLHRLKLPFVCVLTKSDKLKKSELTKQKSYFETALKEYEPNGIITFSCVTRDGRDELIKIISEVSDNDVTGHQL